jgi:hypothetical protein
MDNDSEGSDDRPQLVVVGLLCSGAVVAVEAEY